VGTSGGTKRQIADDLRVGLSTLTRWISKSRDHAPAMADTAGTNDVMAELKRLRRENEILRQERDILKRATLFRQGGTSMRFKLVDEAKKDFPRTPPLSCARRQPEWLFRLEDRFASKRQHSDMVMLAHVRSAFALSDGTYGSPRMTRELKDDGLTMGRRRTARLMRENGLLARQKRVSSGRPTASTPGPSRRTSSTRTSPRRRPTKSGAWTSRTAGRARGGSIWL
jgi:putative transposase